MPEEIVAPEPVIVRTPLPPEILALAQSLKRFPVRGEEYRRLFNPTYRVTWPFSEEQATVLRHETDFVPEPHVEEKKWAPDLAEEVGTGAKECPLCGDTAWVAVNYVGVDTGVKITKNERCRCFAYKRFYERWHNPRNVGKEYRQVRKQDLLRWSANFGTFDKNPQDGKFQELLDTIEKFPMNCYLLAGPHGLGKTTLMTAMYRYAIEQWIGRSWQLKDWTESVWIANATTLSAEFRAWEMKDEGRDRDTGKPTPIPTIWERKILSAIQAGHTPCIFIEELDKFKLDSEFQRKEFSRVIDAVHSATGQIVVSSNLSEQALRLRLGEQYGGGIVRRIAGHRGNEGVDPTYDEEGVRVPGVPDSSKSGFYINFWNGTITHPLTWGAPQEGLTHAPESNAAEDAKGKNTPTTKQAPENMVPTGAGKLSNEDSSQMGQPWHPSSAESQVTSPPPPPPPPPPPKPAAQPSRPAQPSRDDKFKCSSSSERRGKVNQQLEPPLKLLNASLRGSRLHPPNTPTIGSVRACLPNREAFLP